MELVTFQKDVAMHTGSPPPVALRRVFPGLPVFRRRSGEQPALCTSQNVIKPMAPSLVKPSEYSNLTEMLSQLSSWYTTSAHNRSNATGAGFAKKAFFDMSAALTSRHEGLPPQIRPESPHC